MAQRHKSPLPTSAVIDRSPENTGYWERSRAHYKKDYGHAIYVLEKWLRGESPQPLFREVREGHIAAMRNKGLLDKYNPENFQLTVERQKERQRRRYYEEKY